MKEIVIRTLADLEHWLTSDDVRPLTDLVLTVHEEVYPECLHCGVFERLAIDRYGAPYISI